MATYSSKQGSKETTQVASPFVLSTASPLLSSQEMANAHDVWEDKLHDPNATPMSLPLDFLKAITRDFSTELVLGEGGFGVVYKGVLRSGETIAVKKLFEAYLKEETFEKEVCYLMGIKHQNVVRFVGYCAESRWEAIEQPSGSGKHILAEMRKRLLCFEYVSNKSLDKHISDESSGLEWNMRYDIIKGICNGLHLLHEECCMVHLDLKPENILMDSTMMPKIADFGLSRIFNEQQTRIVTNSRAGTHGYMAPEYLIQGVVSKKADIFSLGVIFIEIITGGRDYPYFHQDSPRRDATSFRQFTEKVIGRWRNKFTSIPKYKSMEKYTQQVKQCVTIALKCVDPSMEKRPTAKDIMQVLNAIDQYDDCIEDCDTTVERGRELADFKIISRALTWKGTALTKLAKCSKDYDVAIETFQKALTQHRNPDTLKRLYDAERAKKELEQQEYYDSKIADEEREKGNEYFRQQKYPEAVKHYTEALRRNPKDPKIYSNRAACYTKLDAMPEGLKDTEKCIELDPTFSKGYTRKGAIQFFLKDYDKAMETYHAGLKHDPSNQEMLDGVQRCIQHIKKAYGELTPEKKEEKKIIDDTAAEICCIDTNQTEPLIITGHQYGHVQIWNYDTQKVIGSVKVSERAVTDAKFIARKRWFVALSYDCSVHVYKYEQEVHKIMSFKANDRDHTEGVCSLAVHPTQPYVLSGCNKQIKLWDWDQGWNCIQKFEENSKEVFCIKFNPCDTNNFASASGDWAIKVWSLDSPKPKYTLSGHRNVVLSLDFFTCDDLQYLVTSSLDKTAKIWALGKEECVHTLEHESEVRSVVSHPNLPVLITGTRDGAVHVWSSTNFRLKTILNIRGRGWIIGFACLMASERVAVAHLFGVSVIEIPDEEEQGGSTSRNKKSISTAD